MDYRVFDLETSIGTSFKRKGNPLDKRNKIIVVASKSDECSTVEIGYDVNGIRRDFEAAHPHSPLLVGQNIKFDLLYIWDNPSFQAWLQQGGKIWDTMVAEYLLTGQQSTYASLDELSAKYGGELKDDVVKAHWDAGIDTDAIDPEILLPYARMDILNTEKAFLAQMKEAGRLGMLPLIEGYMDHLLALTEMEFNGLYVDLEAARKRQGELEGRIATLEATMAAQMKGILPNFNPNSPDQVSAIMFGTELPCKRVYQKVDAEGNPMFYGPNAGKAGQPVMTTEHLRAPLPNGFKLPTTDLVVMKAGKTFKVDADVLLKVKGGSKQRTAIVSFIDTYLEYKELQKLLTTYIYGRKEKVHSIRYDDPTRGRGYSFRKEIEIKESGLIPLIYPSDGCVHHKLDMVQTVTGRLNSRDPNMQNVPTDLRNLFTSRYGKEGVIISFDYSQLEVCVQAYLAQSDKMINDIKNGVDFHLKRLAYAEGFTYEEMCERFNNDPTTWTPKRRAAKVVSFQKAYGAHPSKIAKETGLSVETIEKIFAAEAADYPEINDFMGVVEDAARRSRVPTATLLDIKDKDTGIRGINRPGVSRGIGFYTSITGKRYGFLEYGTTSAKLRERGNDPFIYFKSTELTNYPVQGTAADIVSLCVGRVYRRMLDVEGIKLVNEVHDELVVDARSELVDKYVPIIQSILEDVSGAFKEILGVEFNCPIKVEYHVGPSWSKTEE